MSANARAVVLEHVALVGAADVRARGAVAPAERLRLELGAGPGGAALELDLETVGLRGVGDDEPQVPEVADVGPVRGVRAVHDDVDVVRATDGGQVHGGGAVGAPGRAGGRQRHVDQRGAGHRVQVDVDVGVRGHPARVVDVVHRELGRRRGEVDPRPAHPVTVVGVGDGGEAAPRARVGLGLHGAAADADAGTTPTGPPVRGEHDVVVDRRIRAGLGELHVVDVGDPVLGRVGRGRVGSPRRRSRPSPARRPSDPPRSTGRPWPWRVPNPDAVGGISTVASSGPSTAPRWTSTAALA